MTGRCYNTEYKEMDREGALKRHVKYGSNLVEDRMEEETISTHSDKEGEPVQQIPDATDTSSMSNSISTSGLFFEPLNNDRIENPEQLVATFVLEEENAGGTADQERDRKVTDKDIPPLSMNDPDEEDLDADFYITTNEGETKDEQEENQPSNSESTSDNDLESSTETPPIPWNKEASFVATGKAVVQVPLFYGTKQADKKSEKSGSSSPNCAAAGDGTVVAAETDRPVPSLLVELVPGQKKLPLDLRRVHTCKICESKFTRKGSLSRHMLTHSSEKPYKCLECGKEFRQKGNLTLHEFIHTGARPYQCSMCDQGFITKTKLQIHESIHREEKPWQCKECGKGFKRDADLRKHALIHNRKKNFACDLCGKTFLLINQLKAHQVRHNGEESFKCDGCGRVFLLNVDLKDHECVPLSSAVKVQRPKRKCRKEKIVQDSDDELIGDEYSIKEECLSNKMYKLSSAMEGISGEMKTAGENFTEVKDKRKKVKADDSSETVAVATDEVAMETNDLSVGKGNEAKKLDKSTESTGVIPTRTFAVAAEGTSMVTRAKISVDTLDEASGLLEIEESFNDQNSDDGKDENFDGVDVPNMPSDEESDKDMCKIECEVCGRRFVHKLTLEKHMLVHTKEKLHKCDICGEAFTHGYSLKEHKSNHSLVADGKPYKCQYCDMVFKHASYLKRHESIHTGERPWVCETCGKCFRTKWHLTSHNKSHSGERPFQCELCGRAFGHRCDLKQHMLVHTGERPHVCEQCGQSFKSSSHYWQHMRRHSGEKRHKCTYGGCDKAYTTPYELQRHLQFHTGEKPWVCGVCGKAYTDKAVMLRHERGHSGTKDYQCDVCQEAFDMKSLLNTHKSVHIANGEIKKHKKKKKRKMKENVKCFLCCQIFETEKLLEDHKVLHTVLPYAGPEKTVPCVHCDEKFSDENALRVHKEIHRGVLYDKASSLKQNPEDGTSHAGAIDHFECARCHELFFNEALLRAHELKHQAEDGTTSGHIRYLKNTNNQGREQSNAPVFPQPVVEQDSVAVFPQVT